MSAGPPHNPTAIAEPTVAAVRELAEELTRMIAVAHALVDAGRSIDLAGLDGQIGLLCAKTLDLPQNDGQRARPRLIALAASVEALSRALVARPPPSC